MYSSHSHSRWRVLHPLRRRAGTRACRSCASGLGSAGPGAGFCSRLFFSLQALSFLACQLCLPFLPISSSPACSGPSPLHPRVHGMDPCHCPRLVRDCLPCCCRHCGRRFSNTHDSAAWHSSCLHVASLVSFQLPQLLLLFPLTLQPRGCCQFEHCSVRDFFFSPFTFVSLAMG